MTAAKHEAPAETITSAELIANTDYARGAVRVPGETEDRRIYGQPEAPAEGAGEAMDAGFEAWLNERNLLPHSAWDWPSIVAMLNHHEDAIRARSSATEAREGEAVAWRMRPNDGLTYDWAIVQSNPNKTAKVRADLYEVQPLYTHPAAPSADHAELTRLAEAAGGEALGNLLAVIHGDGGHRALEVGVEQAAAEAEKIVARLLSSAPEAREEEAYVMLDDMEEHCHPQYGHGFFCTPDCVKTGHPAPTPLYTHPAAPSADKMGEGVVPYAVDDLAKALYRKMRGEGAQWHGRGTNRAYYRRLARAELSRQADISYWGE